MKDIANGYILEIEANLAEVKLDIYLEDISEALEALQKANIALVDLFEYLENA